MKKHVFLFFFLGAACMMHAQNVGIGTTTPDATLDVNGSLKSGSSSTSSLAITSGGNLSDFLIKSNPNGQVGFRKGHGAQGLNYIIATFGEFPTPTLTRALALVSGPMVGEIKIFAGSFAPSGWLFCHGQLLLIAEYDTLFALIGTIYGGDGQTTFALPDLRSAVPVGSSVSGWVLGERSY